MAEESSRDQGKLKGRQNYLEWMTQVHNNGQNMKIELVQFCRRFMDCERVNTRKIG